VATINGEGISQRQAAVTAGVALLVMSVAAIYAYGSVYGSLVVPGDTGATVSNLSERLTFFRTGIAAWMVILVTDVLAAWALYVYFAGVNKALSLLCAWLRLSYAGFLAIAIVCLTLAGIIVSGNGFAGQLQAAAVDSYVSISIGAFNGAWSIGLIVFGLHLLLLAALALRSHFVPRIMGILLLIAAVSYFAVNLLKLLIPQYSQFLIVLENVLTIPMMAEIVFAVWLLLRGGGAQP